MGFVRGWRGRPNTDENNEAVSGQSRAEDVPLEAHRQQAVIAVRMHF